MIVGVRAGLAYERHPAVLRLAQGHPGREDVGLIERVDPHAAEPPSVRRLRPRERRVRGEIGPRIPAVVGPIEALEGPARLVDDGVDALRVRGGQGHSDPADRGGGTGKPIRQALP